MDERQPGGPVGQPAADAGEPRLPAPGPPELIELARRSPEELASRLAHVSIRDQARLALQLPTTERLQLLLHAPRPTRLLRALPDTDLYLTVRDLGPLDAAPLLKMASRTQILHLLDLESWRADRFDAVRCGGWVALLLEADEPALLRFLSNVDESVLALLFAQWIRIEPIEYEDGATVHGHGISEAGTEKGFVTPDGYYLFAPVVPAHAPAIRQLVRLLYDNDPERYQRVVWASIWELPSQLEEDALHWRQSRLEEHGFPAHDDALGAYAPPSGARAHPEPLPAMDDDGLHSSRLPLAHLDRRSALVQAIERLPSSGLDRVAHGLVSLANRLMVADGADVGDPDSHRTAMRKAAGFVGIALETRSADRPEVVGVTLDEIPIEELFREGYARAAELQSRAREWLRSAWAGGDPETLDLLDTPIRQRMRALLEPRPKYFEAGDQAESGRMRDFESLVEIHQAQLALELADVLGRLLVDRLGLDVGRTVDAGRTRVHPVRFSTLILTTLTWHAARGEIRGDPVPADVMGDFLRTVASRRTAPPEAAGRALKRWVGDLTSRFDLPPREVAVIDGFGKACLEQLAAECAGLDPGVPVDSRYVSCVLLA